MGQRTRAKTGTASGPVGFQARLAPGGPPVVESAAAARFSRQSSELLQRAWSSRPLLPNVELTGHADLEHGVMPPAVRDAADDGILAVLAALAGGAAEWQTGERAGRFWLHAKLEPLAPSAESGYTGPDETAVRASQVTSRPPSPQSHQLLETLRLWFAALPQDPPERAAEMGAVMREARPLSLPEVERVMTPYLRTLRSRRSRSWSNGRRPARGRTATGRWKRASEPPRRQRRSTP